MRHFLVISLLFLVSCVTLKEVGVFDEPANQKEPDGFNGFYSTSIYSDFITQEVWFTRSETCLKVEASEEVKYSGEAALHLQWDKISQSCEWLGLGIGWDSWNGKDIKNIINNGAIEMMVRNKEGVRKGLPLAACLEDYSDGQAWIGFSANAILAKEIGEEWVKVRLPFSEFEWDAVNGANPSNIKQFIIQFEADGDIYVDDIKVVEFNGSFRKRINPLLVSDLEISIDGSIESAWGKAAIHMDSNPVFIASDNTNLYLAAALSDDTPGENANTGKDIWNGDALEIAFSTDPQSNKKRSYYKTTDQHIGIRLTDKPVIWDWQNERPITDAEVAYNLVGDEVIVEARIPLTNFGNVEFIAGQVYGFELAYDEGTKKGRVEQKRWNSANSEGFHQNPGVWGEMIFIPM